MLNLSNIQKKYSGKIAATDLDLLLAASINQPRVFLLTHPEYRPSILSRIKFAYYLYLYKKGYSVAAILKHKEFFGLDFYVNKHVLIPRPDTEIMVETVIKKIKNYEKSNLILIDIGTGSGCIPISIIKNINNNIKTIAIDISRQALRVAKKNAKIHNVNINFLHGDLLSPFNNLSIYQFNNLIITANLPYLTNNQFISEPSIQKEPQLALVADNTNGLSLYEKLLLQIQPLLLITNCSLLICLEIDPSQIKAIKSLINRYLPQAKITIKKDLSGLDRLVEIEMIKS
ncbi:MAG: Release factor glutamine methyltransferase [Candidatus Magasanikbacteria bacterium GW2011_GWC2_34_16]|uniref:Release factor glutamine methyltransferase n=2 Tax=Candidatus Magasanikiibacteriota TaxID=1752731 RepID=A0A0G0HQ36_9BACT|nr:MAG: Release factor glutamine methyltransferase [Candidatus Magasanikbacteria bacterium GW2011_GWC2_34_16]KKQ40725.1 MAG: Release factor glutamine methyltransferase [Candidatus Magasanikbacteria bacterium GW2011_GWA2_37_8]